ncbi:hypothetical protein MMC29_006134 [Sticta canariensis]|nr:hypothetical protein [Sticta canariensis]
MPTNLIVRANNPVKTYNFDELDPPEGGVAVQPLGRYRDLYFNMQLGSPMIAGKKQLIGVLNGNQIPEVRIPGNNVGAKSFVLKRVRYGCTTSTGQGLGNEPTACTSRATFSRGGKVVRSVLLTFTFLPTVIRPDLTLFDFPTDIGPVDSVVFSTEVSNVTPILTAVVLDDFDLVISK